MSNRFFIAISKDPQNVLEERYDGLFSDGLGVSTVHEAPTDGKYYLRGNSTWYDSSNLAFDNIKVIDGDSNLPSTSDPKIIYLTLDLHKIFAFLNNTWVWLNEGGSTSINNIISIQSISDLPTTAQPEYLYITINDHSIYQYTGDEWHKLNNSSTGGQPTAIGSDDFNVTGSGTYDVSINIKEGGITSLQIANAAITEAKLANNSVTTDKINNSSVTTDKLTDNSVGTSKIIKGTDGQVIKTVGDNVTWADENNYTLPVTTENTLGGVLAPLKSDAETVQVSASEDGKLWTIPGSGGGQPTDIESTDFDVGGSNYNRTINIKTGGLTTGQLADNVITTAKIIDNAITTTKILKGEDGEILKTVGDTVIWSTEYSYTLPIATDTILGGIKADTKDEETQPVVIDEEGKLWTEEGSYTLPVASELILGGIITGTKVSTDNKEVHVDSDGALWTEDSEYTLPIATDTVLGGVIADERTTESLPVVIDEDGKLYVESGSEVAVDDTTIDFNTTNQLEVKDSGISTAKIASNAITTDKLNDGSVSTSKLANSSVSTDKIATKAITEAKIDSSMLNDGKVLKTNAAGDVQWLAEQDISGKADKFNYTPSEGELTTYNLNSIQSIKVEGNGAGANPNTGVVYTNFAGEQTVIDIESDAGFFHYVGQVATYERLPELTDETLKNGDLYSIYGPINYKGTVDTIPELPTDASDLDQYFVNSVKQYRYWSTPINDWVINHCQQEQGCDNAGFYAFGIGDTPNWNRLDGELNVDQVLDGNSVNAVANHPVVEGLNLKISYEDVDETLQYCLDNIFPAPE